MENMLIMEIGTIHSLLIMTKQIGSALPLYIQDSSKRFDKTYLQGKTPKKKAMHDDLL
jgi:hypothetical protein